MLRLIGLGLSSIAAILFLISLFRPSKEEMLKLQFFETGLNVVKNILLGGYSGALVQSVGVLRAYLGYKNKMCTPWMLLIISLQVTLGSYFNNMGAFGWLPIVASVSYTLAIWYSDSQQTLRIALIFNLALWTIYAIILKDYPAIIVDSVSAFVNCVAVVRHQVRLNN